jgi:hypothetical protein
MRSHGVVQLAFPVGFGGRVNGWWWRMVVVALACAAVVCFGALPGTAPSPRANGSAAALARLQSLPLQAQSVISAKLGSGAASFAARPWGEGYRLAGGGVAAELRRRGMRMRVAGGSLSMALTGVGRGGRFGSVGAVSLRARANRVSLRRAGVREWYAAGPLGIEQGFTVASRPSGGGGSLTLAMRLGGSLRARLASSQVRFVTPTGRVAARYGGLVAVDARGRRLPAALALVGNSLRLRVDDRGARYPLRIDPFVQQGTKLTGSGETGGGRFGISVALSADGNTALIGADSDTSFAGAAWAFTRSGGVWTQQGAKLTGSGENGDGQFGFSVALSADGNTALIGGSGDTGNAGAAWAFTRSGGVWTQQGAKLTANDETAGGVFGISVALSADGNTALIGGSGDTGNAGAAWAFTRSSSVWTQQGTKLTGSDETGNGQFGYSVALSADGNTALISGRSDNSSVGAAWAFTRTGGVWTQQGTKLTASDETGNAQFGNGQFGSSVALSADGNTALIGGRFDNLDVGAAWAFTRSSGVWTQQGTKLTGSDETGHGQFGVGVALSADGNTALIGGVVDNGGLGGAWAFTRSGGVWTQQGTKLTGSGETSNGQFGYSVALSADGNTALIGGVGDNTSVGAAFAFGSPRIASPPSLAFGSQTAGQPGPVDWLPVVNVGQAPLTFSGPAQIAGPNATDFAIPAGDDRCNGATLERDQLCWIGVQLTAAAAGPRTATLSFGANNAYPPTPTVSLTGTGVAPNSGPQGTTGPQGTSGPQGPAGPGGTLVLVAFQARVSAKRVVVSYALTGPADITLSAARTGNRLRTVGRKRGRAGLNRITWNRKLAGKRAKPGAYRLIVTATANNKKATSTLRIRLH